MKKKRTFVVLLALAIAALASPAYSADGSPWSNWGVEPYAATFKEACAKAPAAISQFALPTEVKQYFVEVVGVGCTGGKPVWLTPNMTLEQMWTGGSKPHVMNRKSVAELPVPQSPDGRPYRKGSVAQTVKAFSWGAIHEGKMYILYFPFVCFNWSWTFGPDPVLPPSAPQVLAAAAVPEKCATVEYVVEPGDEVRYAVLARKRLPASACWQLCDGKNCSAPPSACDDCDWMGPKSVIKDDLEPVHTGRYVATAARQSLRFPREVTSSYAALCVLRDGLVGESDSWVVPPSVWNGAVTSISIPYGAEEWPVWGQYDSSK